jgi:hypothetical protein
MSKFKIRLYRDSIYGAAQTNSVYFPSETENNHFQKHHLTFVKVLYLRMRGKQSCAHIANFSLSTEIPKISNTQATAGSDEGGGGAGGGRGK